MLNPFTSYPLELLVTVILIVSEIDLVVSTLSVAVIVTLDVPVDEGDPDNVPDVGLIVRPVGKLVEE